jgi:hypothetical protein
LEAQLLFRDKVHFRKTGAEFLQHDASLKPPERGAKAKMRPVSESQILIGVVAMDIETLGIGKDREIALVNVGIGLKPPSSRICRQQGRPAE